MIIVTSGMKDPPKKLEFLQFLSRFQASPLLFIRNSYLSKNLITIFGNTIRHFSRFIEVTEIRDADKANQDKKVARLFCLLIT